MNNVNDTIAAFRELVPLLAREFTDEIEVIEHRPEWPAHPLCAAYYAGRKSICRSHIDSFLAKQKNFDGKVRDVIVIVEPSVEMFLHEMAHAVERPGQPMPFVAPTKSEVDFSIAIIDKWALSQDPFRGIDPEHNAIFLRNVCHLWARAEYLGLQVQPHKLSAAGDGLYGWSSPIFDFYITLLNETQSMLGCTFAGIQATSPPPAFVDLVLRNALQ